MSAITSRMRLAFEIGLYPHLLLAMVVKSIRSEIIKAKLKELSGVFERLFGENMESIPKSSDASYLLDYCRGITSDIRERILVDLDEATRASFTLSYYLTITECNSKLTS